MKINPQDVRPGDVAVLGEKRFTMYANRGIIQTAIGRLAPHVFDLVEFGATFEREEPPEPEVLYEWGEPHGDKYRVIKDDKGTVAQGWNPPGWQDMNCPGALPFELARLATENRELTANQSRWIPVGERLPEKPGRYPVRLGVAPPGYVTARFNGAFPEHITHWLPVPPLPDSQGGEK